MKVKELATQLQQLDGEIEVLCWTEDTSLMPPKQGSRVLEILEAKLVEGEKKKIRDGLLCLKLEKGQGSRRFLLLDVISEI